MKLNVELDNFISELKNDISKDIIDGLDINKISEKNNLNVLYINKALNTQETENVSIEKEIINKSFLTNKDFVTDVTDYDENRFYILNVENIYPSVNIEYDEIYKTVIQDWLKNERKEFIKNEFKRYEDYLTYLSSQYNKKIESTKINKTSSNLPTNLIKDIFNNELNEQLLYFNEEQEIYLVKIKKIIIDNDFKSSETSISLNSDLKSAFGNEIIKNKKISTNDALLNALISKY